MYSDQWALNSTYGINVQGAWDITRGSSSVRVGVIDTGIASHTDLNSNVTTGKDFDENTTDSSNTSDDLKGHGTSVAGIIGAVSNTQGICGIAPNVTIVPLQISNVSSGTSSESYEIAAIQYAINLWGTKNQISVLNLSYSGYGKHTALLSYIENFPGLFVWSAGNNGDNVDNYTDIAKFKIDNLISVGGIDRDGNRSVWSDTKSSNYGKNVDIFAPGGKGVEESYVENIVTTSKTNNGYRAFCGTSAAAPHVSGVAALIYSVNPYLTAAEVKNIILNGADTFVLSNGENISSKRLNAYKALLNTPHTHTYTKSFTYVSNTYHKAYCVCGANENEFHYTDSDHLNSSANTAVCLGCGATIDLSKSPVIMTGVSDGTVTISAGTYIIGSVEELIGALGITKEQANGEYSYIFEAYDEEFFKENAIVTGIDIYENPEELLAAFKVCSEEAA